MPWWDEDVDDDEPGYDESDVRVRPARRGSRPRTKQQPGHEDARPGLVLGVDRGRYTVLLDESGPHEREVTATRGSRLRRTRLVTGDEVELVGDLSGEAGTLARIVRLGERTTLLRRSADDTDEVERVIVANADRMLIVVAAADPAPRIRLVDRCLVAAFDAGITPMICVTKTDLADPNDFLAKLAGLDLPVFTRGSGRPATAEIARALVGHRTVFVGHSGVGKSTLINDLVPGADRATGAVNTVTGRGRHTSSSSRALRLEAPATRTDAEAASAASDAPTGHGWVIDTPGVRSFGLGHVDPRNILSAFTDLAEIARECPRGCTHLPDAPDCVLNERLADGTLGAAQAARLDSLQRLLAVFAPAPG